MTETNKKKPRMVNITINIPHLYDENIHKLMDMKIFPSRSEAIRVALKEYLQEEYNENLGLLGFFKKK
ncbi:MAG: ribbon-helix-helix protein, CopG family [Candidatus Lokiarchaeota archaeon]|nr:ribbon-helix-helix protein, CopG family [Candidatus Lokiarchaeota archaeon]